jgi:hypothetical protein
MAGTSWCVTFEDVADATAMKMKLENCVFWRKCSAASVQIIGVKLVFHFVSGIERQEVQKKCAQTFKAYGNFKSFSIVAQTGPRPKLETLQKAGNIYGNNFRKFPENYGWPVCIAFFILQNENIVYSRKPLDLPLLDPEPMFRRFNQGPTHMPSIIFRKFPEMFPY